MRHRSTTFPRPGQRSRKPSTPWSRRASGPCQDTGWVTSPCHWVVLLWKLTNRTFAGEIRRVLSHVDALGKGTRTCQSICKKYETEGVERAFGCRALSDRGRLCRCQFSPKRDDYLGAPILKQVLLPSLRSDDTEDVRKHEEAKLKTPCRFIRQFYCLITYSRFTTHRRPSFPFDRCVIKK